MNINDIISDSCVFLSGILGTNIEKDVNIFESGVNSIISIKWITFLWKKYKIKLDYNSLLDFNTVEDVVASFFKSNVSDAQCILHEEVSEKNSEKAPLCSSQKGIWMYELMHEQTKFILAAYTLLEGKWSIERLRSVVESVVSENDIFRVKFAVDSKGNAYQYLDNAASPKDKIRVINVSSIEEAEKTAKELCAVKWNIEQELPFKILIASVNDELHCIYYMIHHIIADEETFEIINRKILNKYFSVSEEKNNTSYLNYCNESIAVDNSEIIRYWNEILTEDKIVKYSFLEKSVQRKELEFTIPDDVIKNLSEYAANQKTTLYTAFLSVVLISLYLFNGRKKSFVSTAISDRINYGEYIDSCGMFVNNVILDFDINFRNTFADIISVVKCKLSGAKSHSRLSLDDLITLSGAIDKSYLKLQDDIVFNFIDYERKDYCSDTLIVHPMKYMVKPENGLNIYVQHIKGEYVCNLDSIACEISYNDLETISEIILKILNNCLYESETEIINY